MKASLGLDEQRALLGLAREAIRARLEGRPPAEAPVAPRLLEPGGAFVTLSRRSDGGLRGCIGFIEASRPLAEAVAEAAVLAATADTRFEPVEAAELERLQLEISVLSPLEPARPEDVVVGRHGLMIRHAGRSGLLLPQVAEEHDWDRETFLDQTCRKAGLPQGAWRQPGAELRAFTAQVFGEEKPRP